MKRTRADLPLNQLRKLLNNFKRRRNQRNWSHNRAYNDLAIDETVYVISNCIDILRSQFRRLEAIETKELKPDSMKPKFASRNNPQATN